MDLKIDVSGAPLYLQIVDQIRKSVAAGRLKPEDPLPSVRQLALELAINPNTVARAYLELEHERVIYKRQGQGTYVSPNGAEASRRERRAIVSGLFDKAIAEAAGYGMTAPEIESLYRQAMRRSKPEQL